MSLTKIVRNFQVTIPAKIRGDLGLKEGDYLEVSVRNGAVILSPVTTVKVSNKKNGDSEKQK
jgi:AbrB family looped-hinge helix DNA binding protein